MIAFGSFMPAGGRRRPLRPRRLVTMAALLLFAAAPARAAQPVRAPTDPARLVFLIEYVGTDYPNAVQDGRVLEQDEYGEVLRLTKQVIREYGASTGRTEAVTSGLRELEQLIVRRAPGDQVWTATRRLIPGLARSLGGVARPTTLPNLANGGRLWASDCAPCHGPTGGGDGAAAPGMDPPPTAMRGDLMDRLSPRQVFNAVTFGVDDTAMPSFAAAYSEQQRWDVAFFVLTLRADFEPKRPGAGQQVALDDLAASSNSELLAKLREKDQRASPAEVDYFRVNFVSSVGASVPLAGRAVEPSQSVSTALQLQDAFADVAERVLPYVVGLSSYVRDPAYAPERLRAEKGDAWMTANPDLVRHAGFRRVHTGSGLIVDAEGYVLTCDHLLRGEDGAVVPFVEIELSDQSHVPMSVVGTEPTIDLGVLRVADERLLGKMPPGLEFGDSDRLQVGHWLIALGDPPGPERLFRVGVVSSPPSRQCYQEELTATALQTSLDVPAGALGGPVVDILGHVAGLSVRPASVANPPATVSASARTDAPGFTLPINLVLNIFEALKVAQSRRSPWLGISVLELPTRRRRIGPEAVPDANQLPRHGVFIDNVFDPSPAARAGVRPGDYLLALGGHQLGSVGDFQTWLYVLGIGRHAELELFRDGQPLSVVATIEERPESARPR